MARINDETDDKEICIQCGGTIPKVCLSRSVGPFQVHSPLMQCPRCMYWEMVRKITTCKCPFVVPYPRSKRNGDLPKVIQEAIDNAINQAKQEHDDD